MAYALVTSIQETNAAASGADVTFMVVFGGTGITGTDITTVVVNLLPGDQPVDIRSKLSDAVGSQAVSLGYSLAATDITLPSFQKGL